MRLWPYVLAWLGLMAVPCAYMGMGIRALVRTRPFARAILPAAAWTVGSLVMLFIAIGINWACFQGPAEKAHEEMLADAGSVAGKPASSLRARYGAPKKIHQDENVPGRQHWWYAPGPWFIWEDDYVGFLVDDGRVAQAYLQVN
jgi:hypothetical protein